MNSLGHRILRDETSQPEAETAGLVLPCWSCKGPLAEPDLFCGTCTAVQPARPIDHFTRLELPQDFRLDESELERRYFALQRRLHPDRFATRTPRERMISQQQATEMNEAYETLKDPLRRAAYLLHLRGAGVSADGCNTINDPVLLMEAMEMREALAEAETVAAVQTILDEAEGDIRHCVEFIAEAFAKDDLRSAGKLVTRLKYLTKLAEDGRSRRSRLNARALALPMGG